MGILQTLALLPSSLLRLIHPINTGHHRHLHLSTLLHLPPTTMHSFTASAVASVLAFGALSARAQSTDMMPTQPANASEIAYVEAQYNASGFDAPIGNSQSFNISLDAKALLEVMYGDTLLTNGAAYSADAVAQSPTIYVYPAEGANITAEDRFTLMLADASALGNPDAEGDYRHYLANDVHAPANWTSEELIFSPINETVITYYAGPGPIEGTGAHRYAWLLFQQPSNFTAPEGLATSGVAPSHWSVQNYVQESNLGELIAAAFFTVENGAPTVSAVATSSVDSATLVIPTTTSGATAATGASSAGGVPAAGASPTTGGNGTGAASSAFALSGVVGYLVAIAAAAVVFA